MSDLANSEKPQQDGRSEPKGEIIATVHYSASTLRLANPELASLRVAAKLKARGIL